MITTMGGILNPRSSINPIMICHGAFSNETIRKTTQVQKFICVRIECKAIKETFYSKGPEESLLEIQKSGPILTTRKKEIQHKL